ncbi:DUF1850 domain-containing protein [Pseudothermotoga sp.]|uniref:DUF1850 domain-containing protein n=1 Tax=Pseudothermotoga sp. TaxID=2033661 RepID=UPI0031F60FB9
MVKFSLCFCAFLSTIIEPEFVFLIEKQGEVIFEKRLEEPFFSLVFIHSVERTKVEERFRIEPNGEMLLYECRYSSYGAGLPSDIGGGFALEDGEFVLKLDRRFERITLRVSHIDGHGIVFKDGPLWFKSIANVGDTLTFYVKPKLSKRSKIF